MRLPLRLVGRDDGDVGDDGADSDGDLVMMKKRRG